MRLLFSGFSGENGGAAARNLPSDTRTFLQRQTSGFQGTEKATTSDERVNPRLQSELTIMNFSVWCCFDGMVVAGFCTRNPEEEAAVGCVLAARWLRVGPPAAADGREVFLEASCQTLSSFVESEVKRERRYSCFLPDAGGGR